MKTGSHNPALVFIASFALVLASACSDSEAPAVQPIAEDDPDTGNNAQPDVPIEDETDDAQCTDDDLSGCPDLVGAEAVACLDEGVCGFACDEGFSDLNGDLNQGAEGNGCECQLREELCDGIDNDCDGLIDADDEDLSPTNCTEPPNSLFLGCVASQCTFECEDGFEDKNMDLGQEGSDGCECQRGVELCDGVDNDCDGDIDADDDELSLETCAPVEGASPSSCVGGACQYGCDEGLADANGDLGQGADGDGCECAPTDPLDEVCDGLDNDCDGDIDADDDGLSLATCAQVDGAEASGCVEGACEYRCLAGFVDINGDLDQGTDGNGCECQQTEPIDEVCDGVDNDCDGDIDGDDDDFAPALCAEQQGVCEGSVAICDGGNEQICDEDLYLAHDPLFSGLPNSFEVLCDGADNNCDGQDDELCCDEDEGDVLIVEPANHDNQLMSAAAMDNEGRIFVAWQETNGNLQSNVTNTGVVRWAILGRDGQIVAGPQAFDVDFVEDIQPAVAFDGAAFVMVWIKNGETDSISWTRISSQGQLLNGPRDVVSDIENDLTLRDVALVPTNDPDESVLMAWSQAQGCTNSQANSCIRSRTIASDRELGDIQEASETTGVIEARTPSIVLKEDRGLITWHDNAFGSAAVGWVLLDEQHVPTGEIRSSPLGIQNLGILPTSAPTPDGFLLVFADSDNGTLQIHTLNLDNDAVSLGDPVSITSGGDDKTNPQLAALDETLALVWIDNGNSFVFQQLTDDGSLQGDSVTLITANTVGFRPNTLARVPDVGAIWLSSFDDGNIDDTRIRFNTLNAQGDRLCFGQE